MYRHCGVQTIDENATLFTMVDRYPAIFTKFMSFTDDATYRKDTVFSTEDLLRITPHDICRWLNLRAYGDPAPTPDMKPIYARSTTLVFDKKAISSFMPRQGVQWDSITGHGNPTRSDAVNKLIKGVEKHEVRREGVESKARRAIEFKEFVDVLGLVRSGKDRAPLKSMVASVLTLQWHLIARIDDMMKLRFADLMPNLQQPSTLICQMRWSKNILEERDAPEQIVVGSMDPIMCPLLSLSVYLESSPHATASQFLFGNPSVGDRVVRRCLQAAFNNSAFGKMKSGNMGTHSLRKGSATYGTRSGLSKDYVNRRGRWRTKKAMVDTYIENTQPYPDACAAATLAGPQGPCRYLIKQGLQFITRAFLTEEIAPVAQQVLGQHVAEVLAAPLLWAALVPNDTYSPTLLPPELKNRIVQAYVRIGGNPNMNPVERESFHVVGDGAELQLVGIRESEAGEAEPVATSQHTNSGPESSRRQSAAVQAQLFAIRRYLTDMMGEVLRSRARSDAQQQRLSAILKRVLMRPVLLQPATTRTPQSPTQQPDDLARRPPQARLSKRPKDLYELWHEYEFGCGGLKAASSFTEKERGANKCAYSRRKVFWEAVARLVRAGYTSDTAIDRVYAVYGRQFPVQSSARCEKTKPVAVTHLCVCSFVDAAWTHIKSSKYPDICRLIVRCQIFPIRALYTHYCSHTSGQRGGSIGIPTILPIPAET